MKVQGVLLPIVTPFLNGEVDFRSYKGLINHYIAKNISGLVPLGTTGENPTIEEDEFIQIIERTIEAVNERVPVYFGLGGNDTKRIVKQMKRLEGYEFQGILSVSPYYSRPSQSGIYEHFKELSEHTDRNIIIYNIPYRTGRNIENETIFKIAELKNVVGIKDACGDFKQSMELILNKPDGFSVLCGEDILYYPTLVLGGDGGVLASAHVKTERFIKIFDLVRENNHNEALTHWRDLVTIIPLLFIEPSPGPIKYMLKEKNMISSEETRLPITGISGELKKRLDGFM